MKEGPNKGEKKPNEIFNMVKGTCPISEGVPFASSSRQRLGRFLGTITGRDLVFASPTGYMLTSSGVSFIEFGVVHSIDASKTIGDFPAVLMNFKQLFSKLNRFICN